MNLAKLIEFLRARTKLLVWLSFALLGIVFLVDALLIHKEHAHTKIEHFPGFWSFFGFAACVAIILLSKWFGHAGIMKREDYYDE
jgi:predicted tellurium resistance membrane protein TerC